MKNKISKGLLAFLFTFAAAGLLVDNQVDAACCSMGVKEIEIDIDYRKGDVEIDYEVKKNNRIEAEYEDEPARIKYKGLRAQEKIEDALAGYDFTTRNTREIKEEIISRFDLDSNYKKFEYEVKLNNGQKIKFESR